MEDIKTLNDLKLLQMGWAYDLNFPRSFRLLSERRYLETIRDSIIPFMVSRTGLKRYGQRSKNISL
jgi:hypothetical protein